MSVLFVLVKCGLIANTALFVCCTTFHTLCAEHLATLEVVSNGEVDTPLPKAGRIERLVETLARGVYYLVGGVEYVVERKAERQFVIQESLVEA